MRGEVGYLKKEFQKALTHSEELVAIYIVVKRRDT